MECASMKVAFFVHHWEKNSVVIDLNDFVNDLRGPRWKVQTEAYRDFLCRGMVKEATDIKDKMNGIVTAGTCRGGHADAQVATLSGWMMFDFDHLGGRTAEVVETLAALDYVGVVFVSISGEGVKAFVRIDVENQKEYALAYPIVGQELDARTGVHYDPACSNLGRSCYSVYDPEVYYRPEATPFEWRGKTPVRVPAAPLMPVPVTGQDCGGYMRAFLDEFAGRNAFVRGGRHSFMLKLGRVASYKGFSQMEIEKLATEATARFAESDYLPAEGMRDLLSGYQYAGQNPLPVIPFSRVHKGSGFPMNPIPGSAGVEEEEAVLENNNELRALLPLFPESVYDALPKLLKRSLLAAHTPRERDMLLMGVLVNLSVCLPGVRFVYAGVEYSPHFYFAGIATAGTGKGVVALASYLSQPLHEQYARKAMAERKVYERKKRAWDLEVQQAFKQ